MCVKPSVINLRTTESPFYFKRNYQDVVCSLISYRETLCQGFVLFFKVLILYIYSFDPFSLPFLPSSDSIWSCLLCVSTSLRWEVVYVPCQYTLIPYAISPVSTVLTSPGALVREHFDTVCCVS